MHPATVVVAPTLLPETSANTPSVSRITAAEWNAQSGQGSFTTTSLSGATSGWTVSFQSSADDANLNIPLGFTTTFNGLNYTSVFIGSNTYITYGGGSSNYAGLSYSNPNLPGIHLGSSDNSYQLVMYRTENGGNTVRIRYEGTASTGGSLGSPNIVYEAIYFRNSSRVFIAIGQQQRNGGVQGLTNGSTLLAQFPDASLFSVAKPAYYMISAGPVVSSARGGTISTNTGVPITDTITSTLGIGAVTLSMDTANTGVTFNAATGVITFSPTSTGTFTQTITARDSQNQTGTLVLTFTANAPPTNSQSSSTLTTTLGRISQETMTIVGGTAPFRFVRTSSSAQSGITLDTSVARSAVLRVAATGVIAGTTTETITCTDAVGAVTVAVFTTIVRPAPTLTNVRGYSVPATVGTPIVETISVTGGTAPFSYVLTGTLTSGNIFLDTSTASSGFVRLRSLSTLPVGTYFETITATDARGATASIGMRVTASSAAIIKGGATSTFAMGIGSTSFDTMVVTGGSVPLTYSVTVSPSTSGVSVFSSSNSQLVLRYAPTIPSGTYSVVVTATDTANAVSTHTVTLTVSAPMRWSNSNQTVLTTNSGRSASLRLDVIDGFSGKSFTLTHASTPFSNGITLDTSTASSNFVTLNVASSVAPGTYLESITATDSSGIRVSTLITVTVNRGISISRDGTVLVGPFSSILYNGTNQYTTLDNATALSMRVGSTYSVEWWQFQTDNSSWPRIFSVGGLNFGVSIENGIFYFWDGGAKNLGSVTNLKNRWNHFSVVVNNSVARAYQNGVALQANGVTVGALNSTTIPNASTLCIASQCGSSGTYFGGNLTNFHVTSRALYFGSSTSSANFTPTTTMQIDSSSVIALTAFIGTSTFSDLGPSQRASTNLNGVTGSTMYPSGSSGSFHELVTTQGVAITTSTFTASDGSGNKSFALTGSNPGVTVSNSNNQATITLANTLTSASSTVSRILFDTLTATDAVSGTQSLPLRITVNPPISLAATSLNPVTSAGVPLFDTITASFGTGTKTFSVVSSPVAAGITFSSPSPNVFLMTADRTVPQGVYFETITATDSVGEQETIVITFTVNPGLSLVSATGSNSIQTTAGRAASLRINALNGAGTRTFTLTQIGTFSSAITLDTSTAASGFVTLNIGAAVVAGSYTDSITVTDSSGGRANIVISVTVNPALQVAYSAATSGAITLTTTAGRALTSSLFTASLGTGNRSFSLSGANPGITLDTSTVNVAAITVGSGLTAANSTTARTYNETITVTDSAGATTSRAVTVVVNPAISATAEFTSISTTAGIAVVDTITVVSSTGTGTKTFSVDASPSISGITLNTSTANRLVFTVPNTVGPGSYSITVTITDSVGATSQLVVALTVNSAIAISGPVGLASTAGFAFASPNYTASNGTGTRTFSLTAASGITLTQNLGIATINVASSVVAGTYSLTLRVTDSSSAFATLPITLNVNAPVSLDGHKSLTKVYGDELTQVYQTNSGTAPFRFFTSNVCTTERSTYVGDGSNGTISGQSYTVERFAGVGTCNWTVPSGVSNLSTLVVGGGGAGGTRSGGGGGAGGLNFSSSVSVTPGASTSVRVGAGGAPTNLRGSDGGSSAFGAIVADGGGGGGSGAGAGVDYNGRPGGSGGGADGDGLAGAAGSNGIAFAGGAGSSGSFESNWTGGGGGGAGGVGGAGSSAGTGGVGGSGLINWITGSGVCYAAGGSGGIALTSSSSAPAGGSCGGTVIGGAGSKGASLAGDGVNSTGSGGGGSGFNGGSNGVAGRGGTGVVIVRYPTPTPDSQTTSLSMTTLSTNPTGALRLTAPRLLPVGTYTQQVTVTDVLGSNGSTPVNIVLTVTRATPTVSLTIPGGGNVATYGSPVSLTAVSTTEGSFNFRNSGITISGCGSRATSLGLATCAWTPSDTSTATFTAVFTPTDSANFNSATTASLVLSVNQADTLTVTFSSQTFTFSESGSAVSRAFSVTGLTPIDSISTVSTLIFGTANDASAVNVTGTAAMGGPGTSTVTKAGNFTLTGSSVTFSGSTRASYYRGIVFISAPIVINRAGNSLSLNYGSNNIVTYRPTGTESASATFRGNTSVSYSTNSSTFCSVNLATGALSTLQAGSCDVVFSVLESANYLGDTITSTVTINKAPRTFTLTSARATLKYAETTTVVSTVNAAPSDGVISYSNGTSTGCSFDPVSALLTAVSGTATCTLRGTIDEGVNYLSATSETLTVTLQRADAPVLQLISPIDVDYSPTAISADMPRPTFQISGLKFDDTVTALSNMTVTYSATGAYPYSSVTVPIGANAYTLTPSALTLSVGSINNYNTPIYLTSSWNINRIQQETLVVRSLIQEGITVPFDIQYSGGSTSGAVTMEVVAGGTASSCSFVGNSLRATSTGSCVIQLTMAGNQNYLPKLSDTYTVTIANFQAMTLNFESLASGPTGISIRSEVPMVKDVESCSSDCVPTITGVSPLSFRSGDLIVITGTDFTGATEVIFNRNVVVTNFQVDSNSQITVLVPAGLTAQAGTASVMVKNAGKVSFRFSGLTITE